MMDETSQRSLEAGYAVDAVWVQSGAIEDAEADQETQAPFKERKERSKGKPNNGFNSPTPEQSRYRYRAESRHMGNVL